MMDKKALKANSPYLAIITRETLLFNEMRITAKLLRQNDNRNKIAETIIADNLYQYPTEKSLKRHVKTCFKRIDALDSETLIASLSQDNAETAKQICLYAMMKDSRLVWDFMLTVIGEKYRNLDLSFSARDVSDFMIRLIEQDDWVATWSDSTVAKIKQVLRKTLVEVGYLDNIRSDHLNTVYLAPVLRDVIIDQNLDIVLPAYDCFE